MQSHVPLGPGKFHVVVLVIIILLFTLGSIYSTSASGAEQMPETK